MIEIKLRSFKLTMRSGRHILESHSEDALKIKKKVSYSFKKKLFEENFWCRKTGVFDTFGVEGP